jgi:penicillin-binding protein 1A
MLHASVLITDPRDGTVITWVGGNNFQMLPFDMVLSHRQAASAFKPVLFATALENNIDACKYLENTKNKYEGYENWEPENFDRKSTSDSTVAFWYALTHSMNLPSVDLYFKLGRNDLARTCEKLRFPRFSYDIPSISLGTIDLSLLEIVRAYGAFANEGQMNDLVLIKKITNADGEVLYSKKPGEPEKVFEAETSKTITAILQQVISQGTGAGIRSRFGVQSELAGKTGTAQNYSDSWFIAYTPNMVIGTWVGAHTPDVHFFSSNGSGSALAMPIAGSILKNMENNSGLKKKYFAPFAFPEETYAFLQCDPFHQVGVKGFFNRLFSNDEEEKTDKDTTRVKTRKKEEKEDIRSIIRRLFKGKSN